MAIPALVRPLGPAASSFQKVSAWLGHRDLLEGEGLALERPVLQSTGRFPLSQ